MTKQTNLLHLLDAEIDMATSLFLMQDDINCNRFEDAMAMQFEYLHRRDLWADLYIKHQNEYHKFKNMAKGEA